MIVDEVVKNRIIGAAVITAILAIFVPMFFEEPLKHGEQIKSEFKVPQPKPIQEIVVPTKAEDVMILNTEQVAEEVSPQDLVSLESNQQTLAELDIAMVAKSIEPESYQPKSQPKPSDKVNTRPPPRFKPKPTLHSKVNTEKTLESRPPARFKPKSAPSQSVQKPMKRWVIQLASFGKEKNALEFRDKLRNKGFTAYIDRNQSGSKTIYRIKVGPELDKNRALKNKRKIEQLYSVDSLLLTE